MGALGGTADQARRFMTQLLGTTEFRLGVESAVSRSTTSVTILSAYLKHQALDHLLGLVPDGVEVSVASRFRANDLISGASDIDAAKLLIEKGAKFGISPRLHGKVFLVDDQDMYIGSSNLTGSGFGLAGTGNEEFGTQCHAGQADVQKLNKFLVRNVQWLDAAAIKTMECELEVMQSSQQIDLGTESISWSFESANEREIDGIWFRELPPCPPSEARQYLDSHSPEDNEFLCACADQVDSLPDLQRLLKNSVSYLWLVEKLNDTSADYLRFGELTSLLHGDLLDDPEPYRSSVKAALSNMLSWVELLPDAMIIKRHRHTRSVMLRTS
jgi:hypothetical protein